MIKQLISIFISAIVLLHGFMPLEASKPSNGDFIQISKSIPGKQFSHISINASICEVLIDSASSDNLEMVFTYPKSLQHNMESFDLLTKQDENELFITTEYNNDNIGGSDESGSFKLVIKIPNKAYKDIAIKLDACDNSMVYLNMKADKITITSNIGNISFSTGAEYEKLIVNNKSGDFNLNLKGLGKETSIINNIGQFIVSVDKEPMNVKLELDNFFKYNEYGKYKIPTSWSVSKKYGTKQDGKKYESITAQMGKGTNIISVSNTVGGFIFKTGDEAKRGDAIYE